MADIALLGTGTMGTRMVLALLKARHRVTVWNRTARRTAPVHAAGARVAASPRAAAAAADFVISMVRDDAASAAAWLDPETGALVGMRDGAVAIDSSTVSVGHARRLAARCADAGVAFVDAPVGGSARQAATSQLIYFVGGDAEIVERVTPLLKAMGSSIHHAGPAGCGAAVKLAVIGVFGVQVASLAECLRMLDGHGVDLARAAEIIGATPVVGPATRSAMAAMLGGGFAPASAAELVAKDFGYLLAAAAPHVPPVSAAAHAVFAAATATGFATDRPAVTAAAPTAGTDQMSASGLHRAG